jgi:hypothetical protein
MLCCAREAWQTHPVPLYPPPSLDPARGPPWTLYPCTPLPPWTLRAALPVPCTPLLLRAALREAWQTYPAPLHPQLPPPWNPPPAQPSLHSLDVSDVLQLQASLLVASLAVEELGGLVQGAQPLGTVLPAGRCVCVGGGG